MTAVGLPAPFLCSWVKRSRRLEITAIPRHLSFFPFAPLHVVLAEQVRHALRVSLPLETSFPSSDVPVQILRLRPLFPCHVVLHTLLL